jgi:hypothetical protein
VSLHLSQRSMLAPGLARLGALSRLMNHLVDEQDMLVAVAVHQVTVLRQKSMDSYPNLKTFFVSVFFSDSFTPRENCSPPIFSLSLHPDGKEQAT